MKTKFVKKCIVVLLGIIMIIVFIFLNYNTKDIVSIEGNSIKAINTQLNVNTDNNILYDYIRIWENSDLYRYYKGMSSTSAYVKNNHYLTIKIYTNVYIMYGLGIEFNENEFVEFGVSKSQLDKYTEGNMEFTELTPQQLEVLFERTVDNFKKETKEYISSDILAELNDNQINALTAIKYEWGNIGNFNDVYHLYKDGKIDEFKSSFHAYNSSRPLFITGDGWPARADANWRVFSEGYYAREGEGIVLGKSQDNGILYKIIDEENKYVEVSKYTGTEENILLDETIIINNETYAVTKIGNNAFENNTTIKAVKCPQNTLVEIGERAFKGCTSLKDFAYVDNVTTIGKEAFAGDIVLAGELPFNNVTSIGEEAFKGCSSITSIEFGEVTEIKNSTFENCTSLENVCGWEDTLVTIGDSSFKGCTSLTSISKAIPIFTGRLDFKNLTELKTIGKEAFAGDTALIYIRGIENVTDIGESAFYNCILLGDDYVGIFLPNITMIKKGTFENCTSLKAITYADLLIMIEERAFKGCTSLKGFDNSNNRFILQKYNNNRRQCI